MLQGYSPVIQALLGTLMTWGLTALGASVAILVQGNQVCPDDSRLCVL
jgi:zinc transporter 11